MTPPVADVQTAHREGYAAGESGPPFPANPYAGEPLKPWDLARMNVDERRQAEREQRNRRILATTWRQSWRNGLDAYEQRRAAQPR